MIRVLRRERPWLDRWIDIHLAWEVGGIIGMMVILIILAKI